jgi:hypothetical protein
MKNRFLLGLIALLMIGCTVTKKAVVKSPVSALSSSTWSASATPTVIPTTTTPTVSPKIFHSTNIASPTQSVSQTLKRKPTVTSKPSLTPTIIQQETPVAQSTAIFDVSNIVTHTPSLPAQCPLRHQNITPDFRTVLSEDFPRLEEPILNFLNNGGSPQAVIKVLEWTDQQGLKPDYFYDSAIQSKAQFNQTHLYEEDLTGDGISELIVSRVNLYIFGCSRGKYITLLKQENDDWANNVAAPWIIKVEDLNLDGTPEIVVKSYTFKTMILFRVFEWSANGFQSLIVTRADDYLSPYYEDVASATLGELTLQDIDNNGTVELILRGYNPFPFPKGLPNRGEQYTYMWDGNIFALHLKEYSPPVYRFEAVQDGDRYSLIGNYDRSLDLYQEAIFSDKLDWWSSERNRYEVNCWDTKPNCSYIPTPPTPDPNEYNNLAAYARFRIMLLHFLRGWLPEAQTVYNILQDKYPSGIVGHAYAEMATAFWNEYQTTQDIRKSCGKAIDYTMAHPQDILAYLGNGDFEIAYFGEQSLTYKPDDVCPFK